ncbi:Asparaginase/glutaminase [Pseudooceanicola batsensis HTCC2597]|uniref:Asparaginase/glutaminase n=1 Tax=Pseudooceanicola batsensis (strain ATCC BAA-863 / DSM 15984 / KCTC 12145 / HTCC2597) TaxID=252305 RepID=A3U0T5_PSEBH|nr:Asparaginase/glutaminase [Pseudooceanicola batsensis HTCC2597]
MIGAGGTIAMEGAHPFDWVDYGDTGRINPVDRIVEAMDLGLDGIALELVPFRMLPSTGITVEDWIDLAARVKELDRQNSIAGIVVTHGTATLEETAFFLEATCAATKPVILSGAQRPPNTAASDAMVNLRAAISAATQAPAGVYACMNGQLFAASDVSKTSNFALDAFEAPEFGPLGRIEADGTLFMARPPVPARRILALPEGAVPRVDIALSYSGSDGAAIRALTAAGAAGLVVAGMPPGRAAPGDRAAMLEAVAAGVVVVQSSRALRGGVPVQPYNRADGILGGGALGVQKARILLMLALASKSSAADIEDLLQTWGRLAPTPAGTD